MVLASYFLSAYKSFTTVGNSCADPTNAIGTSTAKQVVAAKDTNSTDPPTANDNSASAKPVVSSKELIRLVYSP